MSLQKKTRHSGSRHKMHWCLWGLAVRHSMTCKTALCWTTCRIPAAPCLTCRSQRDIPLHTDHRDILVHSSRIASCKQNVRTHSTVTAMPEQCMQISLCQCRGPHVWCCALGYLRTWRNMTHVMREYNTVFAALRHSATQQALSADGRGVIAAKAIANRVLPWSRS